MCVALVAAAEIAPTAFAQSMPPFEEYNACLFAEKEEAVRLCSGLIEQYGDFMGDGLVYEMRAIAHEAVGNLQQATEDLSVAIAKAEARSTSDDFDVAEQDDRDLAKLYARRARMRERLGDLGEATSDMTRANVLSGNYGSELGEMKRRGENGSPPPSDDDTGAKHLTLGKSAAAGGDFNTAIAEFTKAMELGAEDRVVYFNRGLAYEKLGDKARATEDLEKLLLLVPQNDDVKDALRRVYRMP